MIARILPPEEYGKLDVTGMVCIAPACRPEDVQIIVIEEDGQIVATMGTYRVTHFEGLWIDPKHRGNAGVARRLMKAGISAAKKWTDQWVWGASGTDHMDDIMKRMGGVKMPVETFVLSLEDSHA